ncbi:MAG: site-2 protease family protein [Ignavibacteria bacterium]|nr:site-2 protease family protein [Ignavibacteria bacterium]
MLEQISINPKLFYFLMFIPVFLVSIAFHEFAHAYFAYKLGDDTAKRVGRLTLNPFKHIDIIGTVLLPIASFASGIALIGWAKPVPINPDNFSNKRVGDGIVSFVGPFANLVLAFIFLVIAMVSPEISIANLNGREIFLSNLWRYGIYLNIFLFMFNLLPIPPLDGAYILHSIFYSRLTEKIISFGFAGSIILILFIYSPLWKYFNELIYVVLRIFLAPLT